MSERLEEQLNKQGDALGDLRVAMARVQKDVEATNDRLRENSDSLRSIADSMAQLVLLAEKQDRMQEEQDGVKKTVHGRGGLTEALAKHEERLRAIELWITGVKFVVAPAVGAILIKEALRIWGN